MYIRNFNDQDMTKFLTINESRYNVRAFYNFLADTQKRDPRNIMLKCMKSCDEDFAFILSQHVFKRAPSRSFLSNQRLQAMASALLGNSIIASIVRSHPVVWDADACKPIPFNDDGIMATAIVDVASGYIIVYEAGFSYVRVKTMWDISAGAFNMNGTTIAVRLNADGRLELDQANIVEVRPIRHRDV